MFAAYGRNTEAAIKRMAKVPAPVDRVAMLIKEAETARVEILAKKAGPREIIAIPVGTVTPTPFQRVVQRAVKLFRIPVSLIKSQRRSRDIVLARQFIMYWAVRTTNLSLPQIGKLMGGRDHTTVLHGKKAYVSKRKAMGRTLRRAR